MNKIGNSLICLSIFKSLNHLMNPYLFAYKQLPKAPKRIFVKQSMSMSGGWRKFKNITFELGITQACFILALAFGSWALETITVAEYSRILICHSQRTYFCFPPHLMYIVLSNSCTLLYYFAINENLTGYPTLLQLILTL